MGAFIKKDGQLVPVGVTNVIKGAELNIEYGLTAPTDTSKLWVKTENKPNKVSLRNSYYEDDEVVSLESVGTISIGYGTCSAAVGTKIYLFGGEDPSSTATIKPTVTTIKVFDSLTGITTTLSAVLPKKLFYIATAVIGTKIYLFGGTSSTSGNANYYSNTIYVFNTLTNTISTLSTILPTVSCKMASAVVGTKIYLFGGLYYRSYTIQAGGEFIYKDSIYVFDTLTNSISTLSTKLPNGCCSMSASAVGTKIYLFGGISNNDATKYNTIRVFDTATNTINTLSITLPNGQYDTKCETIGTKIYLFGGLSYYNNTTYSIKDIKIFDTLTYNLSTLSTKLLEGFYNLPCVAIYNNVYLFYKSYVVRFTANISIPENELQITNDLGINKVKIINMENITLEISPNGIYLGNEDNIAEVVKAAIYNEETQTWEEIN